MAKKNFEPRGQAEFQTYMQENFDTIKNHLRPDRDGSSYRCTVPEADYASTRYKFDHPNRGLALVFINEKFQALPRDDLGDLPGYNHDVMDLNYCFFRLGFHCLIFENLAVCQMKTVVKKAAKTYKHEDADCFVCVILSHGEEIERRGESEDVKIRDHVVYGCDGNELATKYIVEAFSSDNCPALIHKPRLFFIQSCRGRKTDLGVSIATDCPRPSNSQAQAQCDDAVNLCKRSGILDSLKNLIKIKGPSLERQLHIRSVPLYQDSLVMYATPPDYLAWVSDTGSHFISVLTQALMGDNTHLGDVSFLRVLTRVSQELSQRKIDVEVSKLLKHLGDDQAESTPAQLNESIKTSGKGQTLTRDSTVSVSVTQMAVIDTMLTKDVFMTRRVQAN